MRWLPAILLPFLLPGLAASAQQPNNTIRVERYSPAKIERMLLGVWELQFILNEADSSKEVIKTAIALRSSGVYAGDGMRGFWKLNSTGTIVSCTNLISEDFVTSIPDFDWQIHKIDHTTLVLYDQSARHMLWHFKKFDPNAP